MLHIKKSRKDYNRILFNSDFHYGHNRDFLYIPRGFQSAEEHTAWIDAQVASLSEDDLLICLGDVGLSIGLSAIIDFINRIPCETLMVWGNHNSGVLQAYRNALPEGFKNHEIYPLKIARNVTMVGDSFLLDIDRDRFYCTHMSPLIFPDQSKGRVCVCGHSHSNLKQINPGRDDFGKILDCGVENAIRNNASAFFDLDEVVELLKQKKQSNLDHH